MKTLLKILGLLVLVVVVLATIGISYLTLKKPAQKAAADIHVEATAAQLARGEYLTNHVTICFDCHSERTTAYGYPFTPDGRGARGFVWDRRIGFPGVLAASNITPERETGIGAWTDGEIIRAMREGVDRNGKALFPIMPYQHLRSLSDDDAKAIVAYLRTLPPIRYERPKKSLDLPLNFVEKFVPKPLDGPVSAPPRTDTVAYGRYLTQIGSCVECHTPKDEKNNPIAGQELAGGFELHTPDQTVVSSNITPHPSNWMGTATKEEFIGRFRAFAGFNAETAPAAPKGRNTLMPWISFSRMSDDDLGAIYDYLKTVPPIEKKVDPFPDAAP